MLKTPDQSEFLCPGMPWRKVLAKSLLFEFQIKNAGIRMGRVRQQPLETEGFARSQAALPPSAALQIRTQFVFGIGISPAEKTKLRAKRNQDHILTAQAIKAKIRELGGDHEQKNIPAGNPKRL